MRSLGERSEPRRSWKGVTLRGARSLTPTQLRLGSRAAKPAYPSPIKGEEVSGLQ